MTRRPRPVTGLITTSFPRRLGDPAGSFVAEAARARLREGHDVEVIAAGDPADPAATATTDPREVSASATTVQLEGKDITVWRVPSPVVDGLPLFYGEGAPEILERGGAWAGGVAALFSARLLATAQRLAPRWHDVESHWLVPCGVVARLVAPALAQRCWVHSGDIAILERKAGRGGRSLARWLAAGHTDLLFVSRDLQERFRRLCGRTLGRVAELPLAAELFFSRSRQTQTQARHALGLSPSTRAVVAMGRLVPIKGFDVLMEACADLAPPFTLILLGDGPERSALARRAQRHGVDVRFVGERPRHQVPQWLTAADVYVQPSRQLPSGRTEGVPMAVREALAVNVPVIATSTGGMSELGRAVVLVPPDDATALRQALAAFFASACFQSSVHDT